MIYKDDKWVQLCEFDDDGEIRFTAEYLEATKDFPHARKFASYIITHWEGDGMSTMLDYFGPDDGEVDRFDGIDGHAMGLREEVAELWSYKDIAVPGLDAEWYLDILRSKLVSSRLPERLIKEYVKAANKHYAGGR